MNNKLNDNIKYAVEHVEYYRNLYGSLNIDISEINRLEDLQKLPILSKNTVQQKHDEFVSGVYQRYPKINDINVKRTSGSTGKYLKIYWDYKDDIKSSIPLWVIRQRHYNITPNMRMCSFYSSAYLENSLIEMNEFEENANKLSFTKINLTYEKMVNDYKKILEFKPEWMMLQPSIAYMMAEAVKKEKLPIPENLKYIELFGEYLFDSQKKAIKDTFSVDIANMYGCNEANGIAFEFKDRKLHVLTDNVLVEVLKDGKQVFCEEGDIYITTLNNHAMPFIRYETGDRGILTRCKDNDYILELKSGRISEFISLKDGGKLNSYNISSAMEYTNENMLNVVKQYQAIQTSVDTFKMIMVIDPVYKGWKKAVEESFLENILKDELEYTNWEFEWVDMICPDKETGKYKFFINEVCSQGK